MIIIGADQTQTERLWLDLPDETQGFMAGSLENFQSYGVDVGEIKKVEVREGRGKLFTVSLRIVHSHT